MSLSFGGLGVISLHRSWPDFIHGKGEIRSLFFALLVFFVVLVLAYLTNPSENSFRTFLTEQSFRQHLSRLDYNNDDDDHSDPEDARDAYSLIRRGGCPRSSTDPSHSKSSNDHPFHFANRASVSLRTPKHALHSFGVCTIAAVVPFPTGHSHPAHGTDQDGSTILDSWFIGAFGKWWRGGALEAWYRDVVQRAKDEEGWSSGILGFKALDKFGVGDYNGFPFAKANSQPRLPMRGSPPKLRNRERSLSRRLGGPTPPSARSSTPPPLPKSASLPLHATRLPSSSPDHRHAQVDRGQQGQPRQRSASPSPSTTSPAILSRTSSALLEQSPIIAEVLRQISSSKNTVHDLRTQLTEFQSAASQSHASLQSEVDSYRERRRQEEAARAELKARTKTLEDSKRHAEGHKRDAEKRLKAAQSARDECTLRMAHLGSEITRLSQRTLSDQARTEQSRTDTAKAEMEVSEAVERRKQEIKVAEEGIALLGVHARELEEKIVGEKERLRVVRERAEIRRQDQSFYPLLHVGNLDNSSAGGAWSPVTFRPGEAEYLDGYSPHRETDIGINGNGGSKSRDISRSPPPRPTRLSLGGISNFNGNGQSPAASDPTTLRSKGYSIFDDDIAAHQAQPTTNFSPFEDTDAPPPPVSPSSRGTVLTLTTSSLFPAGLMDNSTEPLARSFQSENDVYLDKDWRGLRGGLHHSQPVDNSGMMMTSSPLSLNGASFNEQHDPFEVRQQQHPEYKRSDSMNMQRATMPPPPPLSAPNRTLSDPGQEEEHVVVDKAGRRRWFSSALKDKPKKGLNPDAKVFRLTKSPTDFGPIGGGSGGGASPPGNRTFDALNPNGLASRMMTATSSNTTSLLRAFAPSPAEREVLQRALGGSTNPSLERLPSLSRVGSIPSSPSHVHAVSTGHGRPSSLHMERGGEAGRNLPSWLQSLPRLGKSNFSPWDDDEPVHNGGNGAGH